MPFLRYLAIPLIAISATVGAVFLPPTVQTSGEAPQSLLPAEWVDLAPVGDGIAWLDPTPTTTTTQAPPPVVRYTPVERPGWLNHSDAWWHGVAICEQGGRNDPYYGYFSFMDGSSAGKDWAEQVAMGNALLQRAGREVGPWAASCVEAGYRAAPDG